MDWNTLMQYLPYTIVIALLIWVVRYVTSPQDKQIFAFEDDRNHLLKGIFYMVVFVGVGSIFYALSSQMKFAVLIIIILILFVSDILLRFEKYNNGFWEIMNYFSGILFFVYIVSVPIALYFNKTILLGEMPKFFIIILTVGYIIMFITTLDNLKKLLNPLQAFNIQTKGDEIGHQKCKIFEDKDNKLLVQYRDSDGEKFFRYISKENILYISKYELNNKKRKK